MAKLTRDTALRSLEELFSALPRDAVVSLVNVSPPPPDPKVLVEVKVEIAAGVRNQETQSSKQRKAQSNEDVSGQ